MFGTIRARPSSWPPGHFLYSPRTPYWLAGSLGTFSKVDRIIAAKFSGHSGLPIVHRGDRRC